MFYNRSMDTLDRILQTCNAMEVEADGDASPLPEPLARPAANPFTPACRDQLPVGTATLPNGQQITLLKTLQNTACEKDCYYCAFRAGRDFQRDRFTPDEMARAFMDLYRGGVVQGLFLSSSISGGGMRTQDKLLDTAVILRQRMGFRGYMHLKLMPGAEHDQVLRAMQLADRVSINLEAPNTNRLQNLAPHKIFMEELLQPMRWVEEIRRSQPGRQGWKGRWPSLTTQFVAGGAGESDLELLTTTAWLHRELNLARAYFSRFRPVSDTPLENHPATHPLREHRLYQASFLLRDYGFDLEDLPFAIDGSLPLQRDPKLAWAMANLAECPVEINLASRHDLMRVPGIGPKSADAILKARLQGPIHTLGQLRSLGVTSGRASPFILFDGRQPDQQMRLF